MSPIARQSLSAAGLFAVIILLSGGAISTALALRDEQSNVAALTSLDQQLEARARQVATNKLSESGSSPFVKADTVTLAGAVLQQRVETAVAAAGGSLTSSRVDVGGSRDNRRVALDAELTIAQTDMQKLLYDLEIGRPYLFVEAFEARAPEATAAQDRPDMRVSLTLSGQWGGPK